ncbi:helix-turn-helix domain-containing protein [Nostoc sp. UHCC 0302]|uniref:helix-turn-helix domain-containing protein n=1 Tax=Nostoc sp. UHCC 0302 TaxID=3134896 RepID=UPI00311CCF14
MGCRLRIFLNREEHRTLLELQTSSKVPKRTKDRATALLLNSQGKKNEQIAQDLNWVVKTVHHTIHRWQSQGLVGLWDAPGRGRKARDE